MFQVEHAHGPDRILLVVT